MIRTYGRSQHRTRVIEGVFFGRQCGNEMLPHPCQKDAAIGRTINSQRGGETFDT